MDPSPLPGLYWVLQDVDQETGEDLNPTRSRQPVGGEISEMTRNPDRYHSCTMQPLLLNFV